MRYCHLYVCMQLVAVTFKKEKVEANTPVGMAQKTSWRKSLSRGFPAFQAEEHPPNVTGLGRVSTHIGLHPWIGSTKCCSSKFAHTLIYTKQYRNVTSILCDFSLVERQFLSSE